MFIHYDPSYFSDLKVDSHLPMFLLCHAQAGLGKGLCPLLLPCTEPQPNYITSNRICPHIRGSGRQHECIRIINNTTSTLAKHPLLKIWMYQLFANRSSKHLVKNVQTTTIAPEKNTYWWNQTMRVCFELRL